MLRLLCISLIAGLLWSPSQALAQTTSAQAVDPEVEACLRANAPRVSARAASLVDAADFLLNNVCAVEVTMAYQRVQQARFERMRARVCENGAPTSEALQSDPGDDADTAVYLNAYCSGDGPWSAAGMAESVAIVSATALATPADRALAGHLVLEARPRR
jgi:hypothetical protein